jgi:hypothetical protein
MIGAETEPVGGVGVAVGGTAVGVEVAGLGELVAVAVAGFGVFVEVAVAGFGVLVGVAARLPQVATISLFETRAVVRRAPSQVSRT